MNGCKCAQCFGMAEFMLQVTGRDYGLPRAQGHPRLRAVSERREQLEAEQREASFRSGGARRRVALPWEMDAAA